MPFVKTPVIVRKIYPELIWHLPTQEKKIYLTFDDGPIPGVTSWVLEQLNKYNAKATFFCVGDNVSKHKDIYDLILTNGHSTGNHTHNHLNGWFTLNKTYLKNIDECSNHVNSKLFRPPYGKITRKQIKAVAQNFKIIMWDVLSYDFDAGVKPEKVLDNVIRNAGNGSIVVMHDSIKAEKNLNYALPRLLEHFSGKDFLFEAIA
ncbi:MAG TPA: polysaccharide deacetylase family protein [Bacteroidia bacterium]|nr:polysaccharide deacetylase family protein [Bacteroidia bacterium]HNU33300.1 polysaccharide deacetylase family protein [Bacteroidia bacterium]